LCFDNFICTVIKTGNPLLLQGAVSDQVETTSDKAFDIIKKSRSDGRVTIARELIRSWSYFDLEKYSQEILKDSFLDRGSITIKSMEQLECVPNMTHIRRLKCDFFEPITNIYPIGHLNNLLSLSIYGGFGYRNISSQFDDFSAISHCTKLQTLTLIACRELSDIEFISNLEELSFLHLYFSRNLESLDFSGNGHSIRSYCQIWCLGIFIKRRPDHFA